MNPNRTVTLISVVFILVALFIGSTAAFFAVQQYQFSQTAVKATGTVVELVRHVSNKGGVSYYPIISFTDSTGNKVEFKSDVSSDDSQIGSSVPVVYDPLASQTAYVDNFMGRWFLPVFMAGFAVVFGGVGAGTAYVRYRRRKMIEYLKINGRRVNANFVDVRLNRSYKVNKRSPFVIYATWHDELSNKTIEFMSDNLWFDPSPFVKLGMSIEVVVDSNDFNRYWMNTDFLPQQ